MKVRRWWQGLAAVAFVVCLGVAVAFAEGEVTVEVAPTQAVLANLAKAVSESELAEEVKERLAGYVSQLTALAADQQSDEALLAAVSEALESAEGEYLAFLTGVKVALELNALGSTFASALITLASEGTLADADVEAWTQLLADSESAE